MAEVTGHSVHLQPKHPLAVSFKLTPDLYSALIAAHKSGTSVKFRAENAANGGAKATLTIANTEHRFAGHATESQKCLWLTDADDIDYGYVVANVTHKLHQQKSLATSNISNKLRASNLEASRQKGGRQTQLLDMPIQLQGGPNGRRGVRSVTPPPVAGIRSSAPRPQRHLTPPPQVPTAGTGSRPAQGQQQQQQQQQRALSQQPRTQVVRSLTPPPGARSCTPPPAAARFQQQQQLGSSVVLQQPPQHQQQQRVVAREPPKPKSKGGGQKRKTPPPPAHPPSAQQQQQGAGNKGKPAGPAAAAGGSTGTAAAGGASTTAKSAPRGISPAPGPAAAAAAAVTAGAQAPVRPQQQQQQRTVLPLISAAPLQTKPKQQPQQQGTKKPSGIGQQQPQASRPSQLQQQQQAKTQQQSGKSLQQQQQQQSSKPLQQQQRPVPSQQQHSKAQQAMQRPPASAAAAAACRQGQLAAGLAAGGLGGAQRGGASGVGASAVRSVAQQQHHQATAGVKRPHSGGGFSAQGMGRSGPGSDGGAAKKQRIEGRPGSAGRSSGGGAGAPGSSQGGAAGPQPGSSAGTAARSKLKTTAEHQQQRRSKTPPDGQRSLGSAGAPAGSAGRAAAAAAQPSRSQQLRGSSSGLRSSPGVSGGASGGSPVQQEQHTKHWFTSSSEDSDGPGSVAGGTAGAVAGAYSAAQTAHTPQLGAAAGGGGVKRKADALGGEGSEGPKPKVAVETARASWAVAMKAKSQQQQQAVSSGGQAAAPAANGTVQQQQQVPVRRGPSVSAGMIDIAPPAYKNFVGRQPRSFPPISSDPQYYMYMRQFQDQYATYYSLDSLLKSTIVTVQRAFDELQELPAGDPQRPHKEAELACLIESRMCLTGPWNSAFNTLHAELVELRKHLEVYLKGRTLKACAAMAAFSSSSSGQHPAAGQQEEAAQALSHGGKGMMVAARATPVSA